MPTEVPGTVLEGTAVNGTEESIFILEGWGGLDKNEIKYIYYIDAIARVNTSFQHIKTEVGNFCFLDGQSWGRWL